jgi:hypothetical protein
VFFLWRKGMERAQHSSFIVHFLAYHNLTHSSSFLIPSGFVEESPRGYSNMTQLPNAWDSTGGVNFQ